MASQKIAKKVLDGAIRLNDGDPNKFDLSIRDDGFRDYTVKEFSEQDINKFVDYLMLYMYKTSQDEMLGRVLYGYANDKAEDELIGVRKLKEFFDHLLVKKTPAGQTAQKR